MADSTPEDEREEELSSITAIFPELVLNPQNPFSASIQLPVEPANPFAIAFSPLQEPLTSQLATLSITSPSNLLFPEPEGRDPPPDVLRLSHLPPLRLDIDLPNGYPASTPPTFELSTDLAWLPQTTLRALEQEGARLWEEYGRDPVVFAYIDFLQQTAERVFDLSSAPDSSQPSRHGNGPWLTLPHDLKLPLRDFDAAASKRRFDAATFSCGVCLEPRKGAVCHRLRRCGHVFCVGCLREYYTGYIAEGDVGSVRCFDPSCGKEEREEEATDGRNGHGARRVRRRRRAGKEIPTLGPAELLLIPLDAPVVARYVELKRKKKIESDKTTVYCPRRWCQGPARSKKYPKPAAADPASGVPFAAAADADADADSDSGSESDAEPVRDANTRSGTNAPAPPADDRLAICENCAYAFCRVCGGGWHGELVRCWPRPAGELSAEETASMDYIRRNTTPCPSCANPTQKTHGCNHMRCSQCRAHFCYLCGAWLSPDNPYLHFNKKGSDCYQRLFELEEGDEAAAEGGEPRFGGARGWELALEAVAEADAAEQQREEEAEAVAEEAARARGRGQGQGRGRDPQLAVRNAWDGGVEGDDRGLQRFLRLVQDDAEDGWDSDELEDDIRWD